MAQLFSGCLNRCASDQVPSGEGVIFRGRWVRDYVRFQMDILPHRH